MNGDSRVDANSLPRVLIDAIKAGRLSDRLLLVQSWAAKGNPAACIALANAYFSGGHGLAKDLAQARRWLEQIGKEDDPTGFAPHRLGIIHYKGLAVAVDRHRAFRCFRRGALLGNPKSRMMVALMLRDGDGAPRKRRAARALFYRCSRDRRLSGFGRCISLLHSVL